MADLAEVNEVASGTAENTGRNSRGQFTPGNILRFQRGVCPNPGGRPKRALLSETLERDLARQIPFDDYGKKIRKRLGLPQRARWFDAVSMALIRKALSGSTEATRELGDRIEGKPQQRVEVSGFENTTLRIVVTYEKGEIKA